jgi:lipid II:glycine glycyltransferase (peptidoglycan interpeptide bridge formation enzyme)
MLKENIRLATSIGASTELGSDADVATPIGATPSGASYEIAVSRPIEDSPTQDSQWDAFLEQVPGVYFAQSSLWAKVKAYQGYEPLRLTVTRQGRIVAGAQILVRSLSTLVNLGYVSRGPVLAEDDPGLMAFTLEALTRAARQARIRTLILQPHGQGSGPVELLQDLGLRPTARSVAPVHTLLLNLRPELEQIMAQIKSRTRYNIRLSGRKDIVVRDGDERDLENYSRLATLTGERQGFSVPSYGYYRRLWQFLAPAGQAKLFLAEYQGELIAAQLAIAFGDTVLNRMTVWSGREGKRKPNEALMWAAIQWAKKQGYTSYDFGGLSPKGADSYETGAPLPEDLKGSVTSFKLGFGGQIITTPEAFTYVGNRLLRLIDKNLLARVEDSKKIKKLANRLRTS